MGGKDGIRGYLIQSIIALLETLDDRSWLKITIESDSESEKVDIHWERPNSKRVVQVKSSKNQIGKADAEKWATDLKSSSAADEYELLLVGPCAQSVVEMGAFDGVRIPPPRVLDIEGLLGQAAHLLDKLLISEGLNRQSPYQREIIVGALTTRLSLNSAEARTLTRPGLIELLSDWISSITGSAGSAWERVDFALQRSIDNAIAGTRLGPADVDACPEFTIVGEIVSELRRSHLHEIVGTPGCGKSITAWQAAKHLHDEGYSIWRPSDKSRSEDLITGIPGITRKLLVVDDAQRFGRNLTNRLAELTSEDTKALLVSTVDDPLQSHLICISAPRCVGELKTAVMSRRSEILPIIQKYDDVGDRYHDISFESRVYESGRQNTPWEFFWTLRGGWRTAGRELESLKQFPCTIEVLAIIALGQVASCDAGVPYDWVRDHASVSGIHETTLTKALHRLDKLRLTITTDVIRTKHISYARIVIAKSLKSDNFDSWTKLIPVAVSTISDGSSPLKGVCWLLGVLTGTDAFRWKGHADFQPLLVPLFERCFGESADLDWAVGCVSLLFESFDFTVEGILDHKNLLLEWMVSGSGLVAYFSSSIVNTLINRTNKEDWSEESTPARQYVEEVDYERLAALTNCVALDDFHSLGALLNRLAFFKPWWSSAFLDKLDWPRIRQIIRRSDPEHAYAVDKLAASLCFMARRNESEKGLAFIDDLADYLADAINKRPCDGVQSMHDIFWSCLGYAPRFLRGGHSPDGDQVRVAQSVVSQLSPERFARVLSRSTPRDLENMARSLGVIRDIDPEFPKRISEHIAATDFLNATVDDWTHQSSELVSLIRIFCIGEDFEPARVWIQEMQQTIQPPLKTLFAAIAPSVAIAFYKASKAVELVDERNTRWHETNLAIHALAKTDEQVCVEIVEKQLSKFVAAFYRLNLDSIKHMLAFMRILKGLSQDVFDRFLSQLDFNDETAMKTISQLANNQHRERREYLKLARLGKRFGGTVRCLADDFIERLERSKQPKT